MTNMDGSCGSVDGVWWVVRSSALRHYVFLNDPGGSHLKAVFPNLCLQGTTVSRVLKLDHDVIRVIQSGLRLLESLFLGPMPNEFRGKFIESLSQSKELRVG